MAGNEVGRRGGWSGYRGVSLLKEDLGEGIDCDDRIAALVYSRKGWASYRCIYLEDKRQIKDGWNGNPSAP